MHVLRNTQARWGSFPDYPARPSHLRGEVQTVSTAGCFFDFSGSTVPGLVS
jgi:hypothetical protein